MYKIESLKSYVDILNKDDFMKLASDIYDATKSITSDYPNYRDWFYHRQIPGIFRSSRDVLFVRDNDKIIAVSCLKKAPDEKKICTLYISKDYRGKHIGSSLIEESMNFLGTTRPLITFPDYEYKMFEPFIDKYNWNLTESVFGVYNKRKELCFNGELNKKLGNNIVKSKSI